MDGDLGKVVSRYRDLVQRYGYSSYLLSNLVFHVKSLEDALLRVRARFGGERIRVADLGCGYGVLGRIVADYLGVAELLCVDVDPKRLEIARNLCDRVLLIDITSPELGEKFLEGYHLVMMHGVLEHVYDWDAVIVNVSNMLVNDGFFLLSIPNLGSWVNRLLLLFGYQPRDLEISRRGLFGVLKTKRYGTGPIDHVKNSNI
ncbi:MAG: class I SAM-dependent methyltransferase [Ignisphaera sp.]|uniref:class I SAM-dependent methyltransferase n=2 Tax=Thermoproteota TaxID=28889 RepID=UPI003166C341